MALIVADLSRLPLANCVRKNRRGHHYNHHHHHHHQHHQQQQQRQRHRGQSQQPWHKLATTNEQQGSLSRERGAISRRKVLFHEGAILTVAFAFTQGFSELVPAAQAETEDEGPVGVREDMPALRGKDYGKNRRVYSDFVQTKSGLQYKDLKEGSGDFASNGDRVVIDWDGYTIGYYGRPFEARNKSKGGAFTGDEKGYFRWILGRDNVVPAFDEAIRGMKEGGIRRIVVPPELGYPDNDFNKAEPKPTTFSGRRALGFVLKNTGLIDKTLLFDIVLIRVEHN